MDVDPTSMRHPASGRPAGQSTCDCDNDTCSSGSEALSGHDDIGRRLDARPDNVFTAPSVMGERSSTDSIRNHGMADLHDDLVSKFTGSDRGWLSLPRQREGEGLKDGARSLRDSVSPEAEFSVKTGVIGGRQIDSVPKFGKKTDVIGATKLDSRTYWLMDNKPLVSVVRRPRCKAAGSRPSTLQRGPVEDSAGSASLRTPTLRRMPLANSASSATSHATTLQHRPAKATSDVLPTMKLPSRVVEDSGRRFCSQDSSPREANDPQLDAQEKSKGVRNGLRETCSSPREATDPLTQAPAKTRAGTVGGESGKSRKAPAPQRLVWSNAGHRACNGAVGTVAEPKTAGAAASASATGSRVHLKRMKAIVRQSLDPFFDRGEITNRQYKQILERASSKIEKGLVHSAAQVPDKRRVQRLVADYVKMYRPEA